ncbi:MAG: hypothetical protein HOQ44_16645 [Nocardia sp.]|nr:hypothetical protein [Nocardia sp.]
MASAHSGISAAGWTPGGWAVPLLETLENGRYGRDYLAGLDAGLPG